MEAIIFFCLLLFLLGCYHFLRFVVVLLFGSSKNRSVKKEVLDQLKIFTKGKYLSRSISRETFENYSYFLDSFYNQTFVRKHISDASLIRNVKISLLDCFRAGMIDEETYNELTDICLEKMVDKDQEQMSSVEKLLLKKESKKSNENKIKEIPQEFVAGANTVEENVEQVDVEIEKVPEDVLSCDQTENLLETESELVDITKEASIANEASIKNEAVLNEAETNNVLPKEVVNTKSNFQYVQHAAIKENLLSFLGIFLILAGEVFFVANSWGKLSSSMQIGGIYLLVVSSCWLFYFLGSFSVNKLKVESIGSLFYLLFLLFIPFSFIVPAQFPKHQYIYAFLLHAISICSFWFLLQKMASFIHEKVGKWICYQLLLLSCFHIFMPLISLHLPFVWCILLYGATFLCLYCSKKITTLDIEMPGKTACIYFLFQGFSICSLIAHGYYVLSKSASTAIHISFYAPMISIIAFLPLILDRKFLRSVSPINFLPFVGILVSIAGFLVSMPQLYALLISSTILFLFAIYYTKVFQKNYLFLCSLFMSLFVYLLLRIPIKQTTQQVKQWVGAGLGYQGGKLPLSYYAIVFIPYIFVLCIFGHRLKKKNSSFLPTLKGWLFFLSVGLMTLTQIGSDPRAALVTLPIYGVTYILVSSLLNFPSLLYLIVSFFSLWIWNVSQYFGIATIYQPYFLIFFTIGLLVMAFSLRNKESRKKECCIFYDMCFLVLFCTTGLIGFHFFQVNFISNVHFDIQALIIGILFFNGIFVYQQRAFWLPSFSLITLSYYFATHRIFQDAATRTFAFISWPYILVAIGYLVRKIKATTFRITRPNIKEQPLHKIFLQPLSIFTTLSVFVASAVIFIHHPIQKFETVMFVALFSLSMLLLFMPKILTLNWEKVILTELYFIASLLPFHFSVLRDNWIGVYVMIMLYLISSILIKRASAVGVSLTGFLSISFCYTYPFLAVEEVVFIFAAIALVWKAVAFVIRHQTIATVFEIFSFLVGLLSLIAVGYCTGEHVLKVNATQLSNKLFLANAVLVVWSLLYILKNKSSHLFHITTFLFIITTSQYLFPQQLEYLSLLFSFCGFVWWLSKKWLSVAENNIYSFSSLLMCCAYGVATFIVFKSSLITTASVAALFICAAYCGLLIYESKNKWLGYIFSLIINQIVAFLCFFYFQSHFQIQDWYLVQIISCSILIFPLTAVELFIKKQPLCIAIHRYVASWLVPISVFMCVQFVRSDIHFYQYLVALLFVIKITGLIILQIPSYALRVFFLLNIWFFCAVLVQQYNVYPVLFSFLALAYSGVRRFFEKWRHPLYATSMLLSFAALAVLGKNYFYESHSSVLAITFIFLIAHAVHLFLQTKKTYLLYLANFYLLAGSFVCVIEPFFPKKFYPIGILITIILLLAISLIYQKKEEDQKAILPFLDVTMLGAISLFSGYLFLYITNNIWTQIFFHQHYMVTFIAILLSWFTCGVVAKMSQTFPTRYVVNSSFFCVFGIVVLYIYAPVSHLVSQMNTSIFPALDIAIYSILLCFLFSKHLSSHTLRKWGNLFIVAAIFLTQAQLESPQTFLVLACATIYCFMHIYYLKAKIDPWFYIAMTSFMLTTYCFLIYLYESSFLKELPSVLSFVTAIIAFHFIYFHHSLGRVKDMAVRFGIVANFCALVFFIPVAFPHLLPGIQVEESYVLLSCTTIFFLAMSFIQLSKITNKVIFHHLFEFSIILGYYLLQYRTTWIDFLDGYNAHVLILFAIVFTQIKLYQKTQPSSDITTYLLFFVAILYKPWELNNATSLFILLSIHFALAYAQNKDKKQLFISLGFLNIALFQYWMQRLIIDPQFYGIPFRFNHHWRKRNS